MQFFIDFLKGMVIGIGAVAPGVSGGTFAVMLGVYNKLTDAIANIFTNIKKKIIILFPIGLGVLVGILGFSRVMSYLFDNHEAQVKFLFIGLMIGTLPSVINMANKRGFKKKYLLPAILTFSITLIFIVLENSVINIIPENNPGTLAYILYGGIIGFGTIIPGISSSFILMYIGAYEMLLHGLVNIDLRVIIPVGIGFGLSILLFAKLVNFMFKRFYGYTYYAVIGFVIGSIITIFPGLEFTFEYLLGLGLCFIGFIITSAMSNFKK